MKAKIYKALSVLLTLLIVFSACSCMIGTVSAKEATYYVSSDGNDAATNNGKINKPKLTLAGAVAKAIEDGCGAGDIVTVRVKGDTAVAWGVPAAGSSSAVIPAHDFKLIVTSHTSGATIGDNTSGVVIGGDTDFENINVKVSQFPKYYTMYFNDHEVNFASDSTIMALNVANIVIGTPSTFNTIDTPSTYNVDTGIKYFKLTNDYNSKTYNADVTFNLNDTRASNASDTPVVYLSAQNGTTTYNANVNINIKDAPAFALTHGEIAPVFGGNGALQIINSAGVAITDSKGIITGPAAGKAYILHNKTGVADLLTFTDTKGEFAVDTNRFTVTATPKDGGTAIVSKDGFLKVPAGEYDVTATKVTETKTLCVETGADGTNDTYATVADAVTAALDSGYIFNDIVTIKLKGESVTLGSIPQHKFNLIIESNDAAVRTKILFDGNGTLANNEGSKTTYVNVEINNNGAQWKNLYFASSNVVISEDVKFTLGYGTSLYFGSTGNDGGAKKSIAGQSLEINSATPYAISISNGGWSARTYTEDVNVIINNDAANPYIYFNASDRDSSNGTTTFNKNLNINIKKAAGIAGFKYGEGVTVDGAFQIVNSSSAVIGLDTAGISAVTAGKKFIINNTSGNPSIIEFTENIGVFKLVAPKPTHSVVIKDSEGNVIPATNDLVTLTESGVYTAEIVKPKETPTFYAQTGSQYETVAAAVEAAVAEGYTKGDIVTVRIKGESVNFGGLPAYKFDLIVMSDDTATRSKILIDGSATIANNQGSKTTYDNVEFDNGEKQWKNIFFNSCNVNLTSTVKFTVGYGTSFYFGSSNDGKTVAGQNVEIASNIHYAISVTNLSRCADRTYTEDVNLLVNNATASPHIWFNASDKGASNGTAFFKKNLNINIRKASGISSFAYGKGVTIEGGLQILNSTTATVKITNEEIAAIACDKKYILNNKSGEVDLVEFTETAGVYKVNPSKPEYLVFAKDVNGNTIYAQNGLLTLQPGQYEIRIDRDPIVREYYISAKGISVEKDTRPADAGTKKNPVKTFVDASRLISADNMGDIDIAKVYIMGDQVDWYNEAKEAPAAHSCTVEFDTAMEGERPVIYSYSSINLVGNTTFKNVELQQGYQWSSFRLNHKKVVFEEGSYINVPTIYIGLGSSPKEIDNVTDITVKGKCTASVFQLASEYHSGNYNADINLYFANADTNAAIQFGGSIEKTTYNYNGNINITVLAAKAFSFTQSEKATVNINGALQAIVDDSVLLPYSTQTKFNALDVKGGKWYLTNAASDDAFVQFTDKCGEFGIKDGKTAYARQTLAENQIVENSGLLKLPSGAYTVSDKEIPFLPDESHKMLYFSTSGGAHHLASRVKVTPGETYIYEFSVYCNLYEDMTPCVRDDGDRGATCTPVIISEEKVGDYYRIVFEATIPEDYNKGSTAFFGVNLYSYSEGVIFDRKVYNKNDPEKKNCFEKNPLLHDGLDGIALDMAFWGATFTGERGGTGVVLWERNFQKLQVVNFSEAYIKELIRLGNPDDGKWWKDKDVVEEKTVITYASAKGSFKDQDGNAVKGVKMALISEDFEYTETTDSNGEFVFGKKVKGLKGPKIASGFYELYVLNGEEKIFTGFTQYIAENDSVTFNVKTDLSSYLEGMDTSSDYEELEPGDEVEEITQSGDLIGTVYTPYAEVVPGVRIYLEGIDGQVSSNQNGQFGFKNLPVGTYRIYTVLADGSEYTFRDVEILENSETKVNLKYDPPKVSTGNDMNNGWIIWVIIASVIALAVVGVLIFFLVIKKKKI